MKRSRSKPLLRRITRRCAKSRMLDGRLTGERHLIRSRVRQERFLRLERHVEGETVRERVPHRGRRACGNRQRLRRSRTVLRIFFPMSI